ncbi:MAG TPA: bifunctional 2-polyprenyl-6-hydroxyphenol methylase/3-demethylubiquinol 3-O-methyltransferase UbiG [Pseudomonadales bacterium]|nr:bifunctional 2-polyprenyl-6-hydroxyphenol methylase/3-demethylubiquinol 3-O-methyltransferase UbiG [Pseudomonadales bacterium]
MIDASPAAPTNRGHGDAAPTQRSVDPEQVAYYTRLADQWWDPEGVFWPLHVLNGLRSDWIIRRLGGEPTAAAPLAGVRVLDIGCGGGLLAETMARAGATVTGIDVTARNLEIARVHAATAGIDVAYEHVSAEALAARGEQYDLVLNMEVVEHVADLPGFMDAAGALVAPGGHMFVATLNRTLAGFLIGIVGAEYVTRLLPRGTHRWDRFVRPQELTAHLERSGLAPMAISGVRVNPLTRRMRLTRWCGVNYMVHARRAP